MNLDDRLEDTWKYKIASPGTMYETPYPSSDTGPNPPPGDSYKKKSFSLLLRTYIVKSCAVDIYHTFVFRKKLFPFPKNILKSRNKTKTNLINNIENFSQDQYNYL